jgi:hypothetical protein
LIISSVKRVFLMTVDTVGQSLFAPGICLNLTCGIAVIANAEGAGEVQC